MHELYLFIKNQILSHFPDSNVLLEIPQGVRPSVFESTISINWSPPTLFQISNSQFGDNTHALFISMFSVIYADQKGKCSPIDYFTPDNIEFTNDGGRTLSIIDIEKQESYKLVYINFDTEDAEIIESLATKDEIVNQLIDMLSPPDTGRPY